MKETVKQHDMRDCGAACLASVAAHYRLKMPIARIRQYACTDKQGTNVLGLIQAAEKMGFVAKGVKAQKEVLDKIPTPAIAHVVRKNGDMELHHFVVVYGYRKGQVKIMDPAYGTMEFVPAEKFNGEWTGVLVLLEPDDGFEAVDNTVSVWRRFWGLVRPNSNVLAQALFGALLYTVLGLSTSIYIEKITDNVLVGGNTNLLNLLGVAMLLILAFQLILGCCQSVMVLRSGQLIDSRLILGYYKHLLLLPQTFFDTMQTGEITSRIGDAVQIRNFINSTAIRLVVNVFIIIFSFALMFTYYWKLALIMLIVIPLYVGLYLITDKWNKRTERRLMEDAAALESQLVESINGVRTIKQFGIENFSNLKTENRFVKMLYSIYSSAMNAVFSGRSSEAINRIFTIVLLWAGSYFVLDGEITAGELMSFYALIGYFTGPIAELVESNKSVRTAIIAADRLFEIMDLDREQDGDKMDIKPEMSGDVQMSHVSFRYGTRTQVFDDFSIVFKKGQFSAIVGESGSGKSTIAHLLQNLYPIASGKIFIGEMDLQYVSNASLRSLVASVPQQVDLFSGTVLQNIALGDETPDIQRVVELSKDLGLLDFIEKLPEGFNANVGENGSLLSGGQRQRLAIARALYKNPGILILDEATSSLDSVSEKYVQQTIDKQIARGKTVIVIAHRLSTIKRADQIFVLAGGKLQEQGKFEQLVSAKGEFYRLWQSQQV